MLDKDKLLEWLNSAHKEYQKKAEESQSRVVEGINLGHVSLSYTLINLIEKGYFEMEPKYVPHKIDERLFED